jgi:hypothetical protein
VNIDIAYPPPLPNIAALATDKPDPSLQKDLKLIEEPKFTKSNAEQ